MKTTTLLLLLLSGVVVSSCQSGDEATTPIEEAPGLQVVNNSGGRIDHVTVGSVTFTQNLSYNTSLFSTDNGSFCGDGCSTGFSDVSEGSHPVTVYQTATSTPVSLGSSGSVVAGGFYAVNIRSMSGSYCAELWDRTGNTSPIFNNDAVRVLLSSSCSGP